VPRYTVSKRAFFTSTTDLVQRPQAARRNLSLPGLMAKLDKCGCLILDDLALLAAQLR